MDEENIDENESETTKKLFVKGGAPGPGRGNKKPSKRVTFEEIEGWLQDDLKNRDPKIRHSATKLLMILRDKMEKQNQGNVNVIPPIVLELLNAKADQITAMPEGFEIIEPDDPGDDS